MKTMKELKEEFIVITNSKDICIHRRDSQMVILTEDNEIPCHGDTRYCKLLSNPTGRDVLALNYQCQSGVKLESIHTKQYPFKKHAIWTEICGKERDIILKGLRKGIDENYRGKLGDRTMNVSYVDDENQFTYTFVSRRCGNPEYCQIEK